MFAITTDHKIIEVLASFDEEFYAETVLEEIEAIEAQDAAIDNALQRLRDGTATRDADGHAIDENGVILSTAIFGVSATEPGLTTEQIEEIWAAPDVE